MIYTLALNWLESPCVTWINFTLNMKPEFSWASALGLRALAYLTIFSMCLLCWPHHWPVMNQSELTFLAAVLLTLLTNTSWAAHCRASPWGVPRSVCWTVVTPHCNSCSRWGLSPQDRLSCSLTYRAINQSQPLLHSTPIPWSIMVMSWCE